MFNVYVRCNEDDMSWCSGASMFQSAVSGQQADNSTHSSPLQTTDYYH